MLSKSKIFLMILMAMATFVLVYSPHASYPMPLHIDEWHHISEAVRMGNYGEYFEVLKIQSSLRYTGMETGFQFFLFLLSGIANLVLIYKFLPALWAALSALVLFYIVYKKTDRNYWLALSSMLFFASLQSNINLTGIWFFTPLTFAIPFIFLYFYFFTEGIQKQKIKPIMIGLAIMAFLIPIHSISVLFSLPILFVYAAFNYKFVIKKIHFFSLFLLIPLIGVLFYKFILNIDWNNIFASLIKDLQFKYGWGIMEVNNSFTEVYPLIGYLLAILGAAFIIRRKEVKKYALFLLWPLLCLIWIIIYRITGISYLSPYQRNLYYLALGLPLLSAYGFYFLMKIIREYLAIILNKKETEKKSLVNVSFNLEPQQTKMALTITSLVIILAVGFALFNNYYNLPKDFVLYHVIDQDDYQALNFLAAQSPGKVMATPLMSAAVYPITKHNPIANLAFGGNVGDIENFFLQTDCAEKADMIQRYDIKYIISPAPLDCEYVIIYAQNNNIIYRVNGKQQ